MDIRYPVETEDEELLLVRLAEEASEVIKAVAKIQRFGWNNHHPRDRPEFTNARLLISEFADMTIIWQELVKRGRLK